jgi:CRP-like cAMP-binding protein
MDIDVIKKVYLFSSLNEYELETVYNISRLKTFNKGDIIFFDTEPYLGFYVVAAGLIKIYKISSEGHEHILHIIGPYNTFGEVPLFENFYESHKDDSLYPANCMAIEDNTQVILFPARPFTELFENNSRLCLKLISGFAKRLRYLNHHIEDITLKDVTKRVAGFVLTEFNSSKKQNKDKPSEIRLRISKNDLASLLGTIPETLSRTFKKLHEDRILEVVGRTIRVMDINKLKEISA